jgi:3-oxoacyl-[acyl-carrier protein] reductase
MIDTQLKNKVALVTGGNNPYGIGAAIAQALASQGVAIFIHYFCQQNDFPSESTNNNKSDSPGLPFYFAQQKKTADEAIQSIRKNGGQAESWEADLGHPHVVPELFKQAEKVFGHVDILVNNAVAYTSNTFLPESILKEKRAVWEGGPCKSTITAEKHDLHFTVNTRAVALLMAEFAKRHIEKKKNWGRIINISADCAWGSPGEISYRASKYALESYSRSGAAELGPYGITVNVVSPGPIQTGYIDPDSEKHLIPDIPLKRVGKPEDIANAVLFFASKQADWITGQLLFVHGGHRMTLGL